MSKRNTSLSGTGTPNNTLFKYFAKSPVVISNKKKNEDVERMEIENINNNKDISINVDTQPAKRQLEKAFDSEEDEDVIVTKPDKKRRRIVSVVSDSSDEETENIQTDEKQGKQSQKKTFIEKLKKLQSSSNSQFNVDALDKNALSTLDEPVIWPHNKLEFLKADNIKDKNRRKLSDPNYDPSTLYVPESFLNTLSPGVRQWWVLKSENFDTVLFFKVGKFYELYHMDADVGVKELGFTYMRGEFAHSGFPEVSYDKMATILVDKGYTVARVEQTETPDMMTLRCKTMAKTTKYDKVVKREVCQITNKGTQVFGAQCQVTYRHGANYFLAVAEKDEGTYSKYGICFADTSIGDFFIGQFVDDKSCSRLLTLLSHYPPVLVLTERNATTPRTQQIFRTVLSNVIKKSLLPETQFWGCEKTLKYLAENYFSKHSERDWPKEIRLMQDESDHLGLTPKEDYKLAVKALGGCISYLVKCLLVEKVLNMARYHLYIPPDSVGTDHSHEKTKIIVDAKQSFRNHMVLDSVTLSNLRILNQEHSLLSTLDHCCTKFGKRLLYHWLCAPSCNISEIKQRQLAISELIKNSDVAQKTKALFSTLPDFERHLAQINLYGNKSVATNHPDGRAIFFEEKIYNKKKIQNFVSILNGFETLRAIPEQFSSLKSDLIVNLTQISPAGSFPELSDVLSYFKNAFDHTEAQKLGVIAPEPGVDSEYDSVEADIKALNEEIQEYLVQQEKYFGCRLNYFGIEKKRFQLEVPESNARKAGKEYILEGQKKGTKPVRRFHTQETKEFLKQMLHLETQRNNILKDLSRRIFEQFSKHIDLWKRCVDSIAILDVLLSLSDYARNQSVVCVPEIVDDVESPFIDIDEGFHPCIPAENYIPNGIQLGGDLTAPLAILTGPNMGGKSTLMRQIGLLAIMAQIGSHIPSNRCRMSIVDRIFTRLGAHDDILAGHSTFLVELNETSLILKHATKNSLVLLDELGRGTATYDGTAIAASVVHFLGDLKCRTMFSTHYHNLVDYFHSDKRLILGHMSCMVENEDTNDPTEETVTFLYKYTSGACPKSYGFNAAKLAGIQKTVINRAYQLSKQTEELALKRKIFSKMIRNGSPAQIKNLLNELKSCKIT